MSDLQCAATLLLAGQAEAEEGARGRLTDRGRRQARALGEGLRDRRVAMVYTGPVPRAMQTAEIAAAVLGVGVRVRSGLRGLRNRDAGEYDAVRSDLEAVADLFRGECVLVVGHGGAICATVPRAARNLPSHAARERSLRDGEVVEVAVDADGWRVRCWAGERLADGPA
jgi:probable phosphoglycerate mutase